MAVWGDEADVDGTVDAFIVKSVTSGTLRIGSSAGTATAWVAGSNDTLNATTNAYWIPALTANGTLNAFEVVAEDNNGAESLTNVQVQVTVTSVNNAPTLSGGPFSLPGTDENTTSVGTQVSTIIGGLTVGDADGDTLGLAISDAGGNGSWSYSVDSTDGVDGNWTAFGTVSDSGALLLSNSSWVRYQPDNLNGESVAITFHAWDGTTNTASTAGNPTYANPGTGGGSTAFSTSTAQADLTVTDLDDVPVITGDFGGSVTEDDAATLNVTGDLDAAGGDIGEDMFNAELVSGTYGNLTVTAVGGWSYSADNSQSAIQSLGQLGTLTDVFTVTNADGVTTTSVTITIIGVDDVPVIGGDTTGSVTEDNAATLVTTGNVTTSGGDAGEDQFNAETLSGTYGDLTVTAAGGWTYSADNSQSAIQLLGASDTLTDTFIVTNADDVTTTTVTITINGVNDAPTLTATSINPTFTEGASAVSLFNTAYATTIESGQTFTGLTLTVTSVSDGADELLNVDGFDVELIDSNTGTTTTNSLSYSVSVSGGTAMVTLSGGNLSVSQLETLVDTLTYQNDSANPTAATRVVTLTSLEDSGGTAAGGNDTATLNITSSVAVSAVNDAPTIGGGPVNLIGTDEDTISLGQQVSTILAGLTRADADGDTLGVAVTTTIGNGIWQFSIDSTNGSDGNWTDFGSVASNNALLLSDSTWVRYQPDTVNGETASLTFHAWDGSTGTASTFGAPSNADPGVGGLTTAFSNTTADANLIVSGLNDSATDITLDNSSVNENTSGAVIGNLGVVDPDAGDTHTWSVSDSRFEVVGNQLKLRTTESLDSDIEPSVSVVVTVTDQGGTGLNYAESFTITVDPAAPAVIPIPPPVGGSPPAPSGDPAPEDDSPDDSESEEEASDSEDAKTIAGGDVGSPGRGSANDRIIGPTVELVGISGTGDDDGAASNQAAAFADIFLQPSTLTNSQLDGIGNQTSLENNSVDSDLMSDQIRHQLNTYTQADYALMSRPGKMWDQFDEQRNFVESQIQGDLIMIGTTGAAASSFTVGVVAWRCEADSWSRA